MRQCLPKKRISRFFRFILSGILSTLSFGLLAQTAHTYSTPGIYAYTIPAGVTSLKVEVWGGGGSGGGCPGINKYSGGGGGGGAYSVNNSVTVIPGSTYTITVGAGGSGTSGNGTSGGTSYVYLGANTVTASGGGGGGAASSGTVGVAGIGGLVGTYSGGNGRFGFNGSNVLGGGGGSSAGISSVGTTATSAIGATAPAGGGNGGNGGPSGSSGLPGTSPGGGGGGGGDTNSGNTIGGNGAPGQVKITYTCPSYNLSGTSAGASVCAGSSLTIALNSDAANLPVGTYTVTYSLSAPNASTGNTATMIVSVAGAGSFTTRALVNAGTTAITITNLASGGCNSAVASNNTTNISVILQPTITSTSPGSRCGTGTVTLSATASAGTINWYAASTGGSSLGTGTTFTTPVISSSATYYVDATNGGCTTPTRSAVQASVISPASITAGGAGAYCTGSTISLTSSGTNITNQYWTGPNSFYSLVQNPVLTNATTSMSGTYTVTGSALSGINLVTNGDFESGNTSFGSSYTNTTDLVPEGTYAVVSNPNTVHSGFTNCADRSATGSLQMVINGAVAAGVNVWSQTVNVVPGTAYQYTYWVQSVVGSNPSQLQLYINGLPAGPVYTADVATCSWRQFTYNWNSGSSTTAYLSLVNQNTVAGGNDFTLDDIVFQQACQATASVDLSVSASLPLGVTIAASPSGSVCAGTNVTFTATPSNAGTNPAYQWKLNGANVGTNSPSYSTSNLPDGAVVICVITKDPSQTCTTGSPATSNSLAVTVVPLPTPTLVSPLTTVCPNVSGIDYSTQSGYSTYSWSAIGGTIASGQGTNSVTVNWGAGPTGQISVSVTNASGCQGNGSQNVTLADNVDPTILNCPSDITVSLDPGLCSKVVLWTPPTASDNCGVSSFTSNISPGATIAVGASVVTYTATDAAGNRSECSFKITVVDDIKPTITCPANVLVSGFANIPVALTRVGFGSNISDNCSVNDNSLVVADVYSSSCYIGQPLIVSRTYTISDTHGNTASCTQTITVNDVSIFIDSPDLTACTSKSATLSGSVSGFSTANYQWETSADGGSSWIPVSGANAASLVVSSPEIGHKYRLKVSTGIANQECYSNVLTFTADTSIPQFPVTATKYSDGIILCDKTGPTTISYLVSNLDAVDNCTAIADLRTTYSITLPNSTVVSGANENVSVLNNYPFPVGISTVEMDIVDQSGNRSASISFEVKIGAPITLDNIATDGSPATNGSGYKPNQGSTHAYNVTEESGHTYTWRVDKETSPGVFGTNIISGLMGATANINWGTTTMPGNYRITVTKRNNLTNCETSKTLDITVLNVFNAYVHDYGNSCHNVTGQTTIDWIVELSSNSMLGAGYSWNFSWRIKLDGNVIQTGTESLVTSVSKTISYTVTVGAGEEKNFVFEIYNVTDSPGNPETITNDNTDAVKIFSKPSIGF